MVFLFRIAYHRCRFSYHWWAFLISNIYHWWYRAPSYQCSVSNPVGNAFLCRQFFKKRVSIPLDSPCKKSITPHHHHVCKNKCNCWGWTSNAFHFLSFWPILSAMYKEFHYWVGYKMHLPSSEKTWYGQQHCYCSFSFQHIPKRTWSCEGVWHNGPIPKWYENLQWLFLPLRSKFQFKKG